MNTFDQTVTVLQNHPEGLLMCEIAEQIGVTLPAMQERMRIAMIRGQVFGCGIGKKIRYFLDKESAEAYARQIKAVGAIVRWAAVSPEAYARKQAKAREKRAETREKIRAKQQPKVSTWRAEVPTKRNTNPAKGAQIVIPDGIKVEVCPFFEDYRFSVSPHFKGEFTREWQEKRA